MTKRGVKKMCHGGGACTLGMTSVVAFSKWCILETSVDTVDSSWMVEQRDM